MTAREELLELSDERDLWERRLLGAERAAYAAGYADGRADERTEADRAWAAQPAARFVHDGPGLAELEARRWHVCCRRCRGSGHVAGCGNCEDRTRETFGRPHKDDFTGRRQESAA